MYPSMGLIIHKKIKGELIMSKRMQYRDLTEKERKVVSRTNHKINQLGFNHNKYYMEQDDLLIEELILSTLNYNEMERVKNHMNYGWIPKK
jgi:hypothetical protein